MASVQLCMPSQRVEQYSLKADQNQWQISLFVVSEQFQESRCLVTKLRSKIGKLRSEISIGLEVLPGLRKTSKLRHISFSSNLKFCCPKSTPKVTLLTQSRDHSQASKHRSQAMYPKNLPYSVLGDIRWLRELCWVTYVTQFRAFAHACT